jgi:iron(III) transport system ATP-binding protein
LLGASGCGKTTLLRLIAGFERPDQGEIRFDDRLVSSRDRLVAPEDRNVGVVFQSYALWPHLSVAENVAYPLRMRGTGRAEIGQRVRAALAMVGLVDFEARDTAELSGGQRQRVALARCLVAEADIIAFDEPLANLDVHLRAAMIECFRDIHRLTGRTILYVTHDQTEALALADRIAVMDRGRLLQLSAPEDLYAAPQTAVVAQFIGRGRLIRAEAQPIDGASSLITCGGATFVARGTGQTQGEATVLLRPEALRFADDGIPGEVIRAVYLGPAHEIEVSTLGGPVIVDHPRALPVGATVRIAVADAWVLPPA